MAEMIFGRPEEYYKEKHCIWTAREIFQQPQMWRKLVQKLQKRRQETAAFMERVTAEKNLRVITAGAGSSAFIGEALQCMLAGETGRQTVNIHTTDIVSAPDETLSDCPTLLISYARSGESPESLAAVRIAEQRITKLWHIIIVCDRDSTLAKAGYGRENALVLDMPEQTCDRGFAMTSSVSSMMLASWYLFHWREADRYAKYINILADSVEAQINGMYEKAEEIAQRDYRRLIWLGSGALRGLAREACVKSMELTDGYVHAGYDTAAGFRHGPKTVVNDETLTVHLISDQAYTRNYDADLLKEMIQERKGNIIVSVKERTYRDCACGEDDEVIWARPRQLPENTEMAAYIHLLVFAQLLSMHKSLAGHFNTDSPCENGEVNRVVQGIVIYDIPEKNL